jgi:hypothetical protein
LSDVESVELKKSSFKSIVKKLVEFWRAVQGDREEMGRNE